MCIVYACRFSSHARNRAQVVAHAFNTHAPSLLLFVLLQSTFDVVKRWTNEVQEAVQNKNVMVQYHALGLLYQIKQRCVLCGCVRVCVWVGGWAGGWMWVGACLALAWSPAEHRKYVRTC